MIPPLVIDVYQGLVCDRVLQIKNYDGTPAAKMFTAGTVLHAMVWAPHATTITVHPAVRWYTATTPPQTGYDQGQVELLMSGAQTIALDSTSAYCLLVTATTGGIAIAVIYAQISVIDTPRPLS